MPQDFRRRKKFKKSWFVLGFLCLGALFFHKPLLLIGCKAVLHRLLPDDCSYTKLQWEDGVIAISGLQAKSSGSELSIDRIELKLAGSFFKFQPKIIVAHPQILISTSETQAPSLPILYRSQFFEPHWEVTNGVIQLPSGGRFYFSLTPAPEVESLGNLVFSSDPDPRVPPMLTAQLAFIEKSLQVGFKLQESDLSRLLPLSALIFQKIPRTWEQASGEVQLEGLVYLDESLQIQELHFQGEAKQIMLSAQSMGIDMHCDEVQAKFSSSGQSSFLGQGLNASLDLKNGNFLFGAPLVGEEFRIEGLDGTLHFEPEREPELILNGTVFQQDQKMAFDCMGKGGVQEDKTYWWELTMSCEGMQAVLSACSQANGSLRVHVRVDDAEEQQLDFFRSLGGFPGRCLEANAAFAVTLFRGDHDWHKVCIDSCHIDNLRWVLPETKTTFFAKQLMVDGIFGRNPSWMLQDLHLECEDGEVVVQDLQLNALTGNIHIQDFVLQPSQLKGKSGGLQAEIAFLGPQGDHFADFKIQGDSKVVAGVEMPVDLEMEIKADSSSLTLDTRGTLFDEPIQGRMLFSHSAAQLLTGNLPSVAFMEAKIQGDVTDKSYRPFLSMLLPEMEVAGRLQCTADIDPNAIQFQIAGDAISIRHPLAELNIPSLTQKKMQFSYDCKKKQWRGEIPFDEGKLTYRERDLSFENLEGFFQLADNRLTASSFYAECEGVAFRGSLDLVLEGSKGGQLALSTSQMAGSVENLISILGHFPSLPKVDSALEGVFSGGDKGFVLKATMGSETSAEWSFKGHFQHLKLPVNTRTAISDGRCDLFFDSKNQQLRLEKAEGVWRLIDGTPLSLQLKHFSTELSENPRLNFALKIFDGRKEYAYFEGAAAQNSSAEWEIIFNQEATFIGGTRLNITRCLLDQQMSLASFEMRPLFKCHELHIHAAFLQNAGFLSPTFSTKNLQEWRLEGSLQTRLYSERVKKGVSFHAESRDLKVHGAPWPSFQLKAHQIGENWVIEHLEGRGLTLKGAFSVDGEEVAVHRFEGKWEGIELKGSGQLKAGRKQFSCTLESVKGELPRVDPSNGVLKGYFTASAALAGDYSDFPCKLSGKANLFIDVQAPLSLSARNKKAVVFAYNAADGLICQGVELQLKDKNNGASLGEIKAEKMKRSKEANVKVEQLQFSLTPAITGKCIDAKLLAPAFRELAWQGNLEGTGEFQYEAGPLLQVMLKAGRYGFSGKDLDFEQLHLRVEKKLLTARGKTKIIESPLWAALQIDLSKEPCGVLKLYDHPKADGLKISFNMSNGRPAIDRVQGCCYGLQCTLEKSEKRKVSLGTALTGNIALDGNQFFALLPSSIQEGMKSLKIGNGYCWQGDIIFWQDSQRGFQANGILSGNEIELLGYRFHRLQSNLEAGPERMLLTELKIDDPAGTVNIKKIELTKKEKWQLNIPQIFVHNLHPSLMHKIGAEPQAVKPFMIKNFTLSEIQCELGNMTTLEGSGKLSFVNQFKKESSVFDIPLEMIRKIGLDPGIMTPVQGEIELELRGNKFYLMSLHNSFSDGGRSEFYLAPSKELSYIDLDGKIHIDLKMHQDVMLKITEPFTLTLRGSLEKPRYGLQY